MDKQSLLDAFGFSLSEFLLMQSAANVLNSGNKARLARTVTASRTNDRGAHIASELWACKPILSEAGLLKMISIQRGRTGSALPEWDTILTAYYDDPITFQNPLVWLLFQACIQAERDFALDVCSTHSREDVLTGRFLEGIKGACASWALTADSYLSRVENVLELNSIDLTVGGGEQATGGDFALILDIKANTTRKLSPDIALLTGELPGDLYVPLIFQAKCYSGTKADISQRHKTRGYQFNRLRQVKCASSYIFYENSDKRIETPALPVVKAVSACQPIEVSHTTEVFQESVNFSTFLLTAASGLNAIPLANTREDALNMIFANASHNLSRLAILGNTRGLEHAYRMALERLREEIAQAPTHQPHDDNYPTPGM